MIDTRDCVAYYLERLRQGDYDAFFGLIEAGPDAVPLLIAAFGKKENSEVRAEIVECIWQQGNPESIKFLTEVLHDHQPQVWKTALDRLVAISGQQALEALEQSLAHLADGKAEWVEEAIEQIRDQPSSYLVPKPEPGTGRCLTSSIRKGNPPSFPSSGLGTHCREAPLRRTDHEP